MPSTKKTDEEEKRAPKRGRDASESDSSDVEEEEEERAGKVKKGAGSAALHKYAENKRKAKAASKDAQKQNLMKTPTVQKSVTKELQEAAEEEPDSADE